MDNRVHHAITVLSNNIPSQFVSLPYIVIHCGCEL